MRYIAPATEATAYTESYQCGTEFIAVSLAVPQRRDGTKE